MKPFDSEASTSPDQNLGPSWTGGRYSGRKVNHLRPITNLRSETAP